MGADDGALAGRHRALAGEKTQGCARVEGESLHSSGFRNAESWVGKKTYQLDWTKVQYDAIRDISVR